ncbi:Ribosomal RNA large subunit methyltransferase J, partial [Haemophilus influenzae]
DFK